MDISVGDMLNIQRELQKKYEGIWDPIAPELAPAQLLWGIGEIGEMIDIIKKHPEEILSDSAVRAHFIEESCDVFMYLSDVLLCYGISEAEVARIYRAKHQRNMTRRFEGTHYPDEKSGGGKET